MSTGCVTALLALLDAFGAGLWALDEGIVARLDGLVNEEVGALVERAPEVLLAYIGGCPDERRKREVWGKILGRVCQQSPEEGEKKTEGLLKLLRPWIDAAKRGALPASLRHPTASTTGAVDGLVARFLGDALQGRVTNPVSEVLVEVFAASDYFVTKEGVQGAIGAVTSFITAEVDEVLRDREATLRPLVLPLRVLDAILKTDSKYMLLEKTLAVSLTPSLALSAYLLPLCCAVDAGERKLAADIYGILVGSDDDVKERTAALVVERLRALLADPDARPSYEHILAAIKAGIPGMSIDFMRDAAPSRVELDAQLDQLEANPPHASLAVIDPLVPPESSFEAADADARAPAATARSYAAIVSAILKHHLDNPRLLSHHTHLWTIRHFVALSIYASDLLGIPYAASKSGVFGGGAAASGVLAEVVRDVEAAMKVIFENDEPRGWRRLVLEAVQANKVDTLDGLPRFVAEMITLSTEKETIRESRALHRVLQRVLDDGISSEEVDLWVGVARKLEKLALLTSLALTKAVSSIGVDSPRLDRYRNELTASITGVPPSKASTAGLALLRKLIAAAPPADSDVVFLPQHRAVNLVKACQHWATSDDEDIGEDVECAMTEVFVHVAPILQNVPGAHWEFIFDVVESNVETCSVGDASTLATLWATVRLISAIEDLSSTNRALRGVWQLRRTPVFKALRDMVTRRLPIESASVPRSVCLEALLTLLQELPDALIDSDTFAHMCPLLTDPATPVQKAAYALLQKAAQKHTERLVIEAGVDADAPVQGALPDELIEVLRMDDLGVDVDVDVGMEGHSSRVFAHLLGWMVLFDLFVDASLKVRSAYVEQLRELGLVATAFIPHILDILRLTEGVVGRAVKLDVWAVDEFYVQYYDARAPFSLPLLAAHLYFRALLTIPSLVYAWVLDCKDRQLSSSISAYTSSYFSPPLIRAELAHVRECAPGLADDAFAIKVTVSGGISGGSGGEVAAVYTVDEQALEVRIRIPGEWPLRRIEVRDHRSVGVDERRWRAWILGIQQTLWALRYGLAQIANMFFKDHQRHGRESAQKAVQHVQEPVPRGVSVQVVQQQPFVELSSVSL
ncbi:hypothetical protein PTI98_000028 [Pleurotus ostreatus]|nr:hypothetical protein PTI98_000028 [Pleurotus ostreatus]